MDKHVLKIFLVGILLVFGILIFQTGNQEAGGQDTSPRNVILIIGDGMDEQQITIARNYLNGVSVDNLPVRSSVRVQGISKLDPSKEVYVVDSASSATAISTGALTSKYRVALSVQGDQHLSTIVELANAAGFRTGIITTASITDATPAAFIAHISSRYCENPNRMVDVKFNGWPLADCTSDLKSNGGLGSIAEQISLSSVDVVFGGGYSHFNEEVEEGGKSVMEQAIDNDFIVIDSIEKTINAPMDKKLLGLFSDKTLPAMWSATNGYRKAQKAVRSPLNEKDWISGKVEFPEPVSCIPNFNHRNIPSLKAMVAASLDRLKKIENKKGFFLMIESALIDKESHHRNACGHIGAVLQLMESLDIALAFAKKNKNTLIVVTADHGQAAQIIPDQSSRDKSTDAPIFPPGFITRLQVPGGSIMSVNYGTNAFYKETHTGVNVPLYANEVASERVPATLSQVQLFELMADYLQLDYKKH